MKYFFIRADVGDEVPSYEFVIKANKMETAEKIANKIIKQDYQEYGNPDFSCREVKTFENFLAEMLIN